MVLFLIVFKSGGDEKATDGVGEDLKNDDTEMCVKSGETSAVFSSLPLAIKWLRDSVQQNQSVRFQVMPILLLPFSLAIMNTISYKSLYDP